MCSGSRERRMTGSSKTARFFGAYVMMRVLAAKRCSWNWPLLAAKHVARKVEQDGHSPPPQVAAKSVSGACW